jgi:hypothetical protein
MEQKEEERGQIIACTLIAYAMRRQGKVGTHPTVV